MHFGCPSVQCIPLVVEQVSGPVLDHEGTGAVNQHLARCFARSVAASLRSPGKSQQALSRTVAKSSLVKFSAPAGKADSLKDNLR